MKFKNILTCGAIAMSMLAGSVSMAFSDTSGHWASENINYLSDLKVVEGYPDGTFKPESNITRAEAAKIIWGVGKSELDSYNENFSDVKSSDWSAKYIATLTNMSVIDGYENGTFRPNNNITRAEFSKMVHDFIINYDELNNNYVYLTDMNQHWADPKISALIGASLISGYPDATFRHENSITRAEASTIASKSIKKYFSNGVPDSETVKPSENTFEQATVVRVVDGDTIIVNLNNEEYRLRMIGVDTPESVHSDSSKNTECGKIASDYTKSRLTSGSTVYLQKDVSNTDRYNRLLRYVWLVRPGSNEPSESEIRANMYNAELALKGYAKSATYPPDVKYADLFNKFVGEARDSNSGLWGNSDCEVEVPNENNSNSNTDSKPDQNTGKEIAGAEYPPSYAGAKEKAYIYSNGRIIAHKYSEIYHKEGQQSYKRINVENAIFFTNEQDAKSAGFIAAER